MLLFLQEPEGYTMYEETWDWEKRLMGNVFQVEICMVGFVWVAVDLDETKR